MFIVMWPPLLFTTRNARALKATHCRALVAREIAFTWNQSPFDIKTPSSLLKRRGRSEPLFCRPCGFKARVLTYKRFWAEVWKWPPNSLSNLDVRIASKALALCFGSKLKHPLEIILYGGWLRPQVFALTFVGIWDVSTINPINEQ